MGILPDVYLQLVKIQIRNLNRFAETMEQFLTNERGELEKQFAKDAEGLSEILKQELFELRSDDISDFSVTFPTILRQTVFAKAYFNFEELLVKLCKILQKNNNHKIGFSDLRGNGIVGAMMYITKVFNVESPFQSQEWERIKSYNKIRNIIAHQNGRLSVEDQGKLKSEEKEIDKLEYIAVNDSYTIALESPFCFKVLEDMESFFKELITELANNHLLDN
ncbi:hypothetical protein BK721_12930 [Bacillus thuringiensis serovar nigeriensis]|uniref:hypothetical protein n=1 Tax=Bacillus thuringiensis TaxID=1428 RepID=UPI000A35F7E3|nr:hypothetical protein [Bacillus thuringiensis]MEC3429861.1 hypothetical protein [Bacillus cereus]MRC95618.1 hypothetical protein [Bacillus thuringiensis]OTX20455.1 hypothetical protein BK721_12930 [Bacillus thuringiensis serovar nigeriensis]